MQIKNECMRLRYLYLFTAFAYLVWLKCVSRFDGIGYSVFLILFCRFVLLLSCAMFTLPNTRLVEILAYQLICGIILHPNLPFSEFIPEPNSFLIHQFENDIFGTYYSLSNFSSSLIYIFRLQSVLRSYTFIWWKFLQNRHH